MANSSNDSEAAWIQTALSELLSAPHISFRGPLGIRMGPGPIDLFSTKFNNTFTADVKAVVAGEQVKREGLKQKLLALQKHYGAPDTMKHPPHEHEVTATEGFSQDGHREVHVSFTGISKELGGFDVSVAAGVVNVNGGSGRKISSLKLQGRPELFAISEA